jgi:hypothetical protein
LAMAFALTTFRNYCLSRPVFAISSQVPDPDP